MNDIIDLLKAHDFQTPFYSRNAQIGQLYVKFSLDYDKGGFNYYTGNTDKRGYRLIVTVCRKTDCGYRFMPQNGANFRLFLGQEVQRKSNKAFALAVADLRQRLDEDVSLCAAIVRRVDEAHSA